VRPIGLGIRTHAHIESHTGAESKSTSCFVDLVGRHTEIKQDAIPLLSTQFIALIDFREIRGDRFEGSAFLERGESAPRRRKGRGILVDAGDASALVEESECVPTSTERAVQNVPSVAEQLGDLAGENRRVKGWECG
jgi:hypothetical protein